MKALTLALCALSLLVSAPAFAQDKKKTTKKPAAVTLTPAQKKQQMARAGDCEKQADARKMEPQLRKQFLQSCLRKR